MTPLQSGCAWVTFVLGLATFALAMVFDGSDPHRVTRRSAQGFWLHLVAAPMIINTVALSLLSSGSREAMLTVALVMVGFAIVAVVIDRRSFLRSSVGKCRDPHLEKKPCCYLTRAGQPTVLWH